MPKGNSFIKQRRKELGFSQAQLAAKADVSTRTLQFAESGNSTVTRTSLELIALALDVRYEQITDIDEHSSRDAFLDWPWSLSRFIQHQIFPDEAANCENAKDATAGILMMRKSWKSHLELQSDYPQEQLFNQADINLDNRLEHYLERYLQLWKVNPDVLQYATMNGERVGFTVVLPVIPNAYDALRNGKLSFMDIGCGDILPRSQYLVFDSMVEFSTAASKPWYRLTDGLSLSVFYQFANLSENVNSKDFSIISFGASPINIARLESIGFKNRCVRMPEYGYSILEFASGNSDLNTDELIKSSTASHFSRLYGRLVNSGTKTKSRRFVIRQVLQVYQRLIRRRQRSAEKYLDAA